MSDILIQGMKMPKSCYSEAYSENGFCPFHCFDYHGGSHCTMSACKCLKTRRPKDCPLIPVPEHGRLIDVDAYIKAEMEEYRKHGDDYGKERAETIADVLAVLDKHTPVVVEGTK